jgi:DNA modification methylase
MDANLNTIQLGDCVQAMNALPEGSVDLAFADPPFNIGYEYDVYDDKLEKQQYLDWSEQWIKAVSRVLKPDGTFWLAIGDEYAAELKLLSQDIGFTCRSWVIWYYTFGVNCSHKFTRSHAHLFHFVKDPENFTFRADDLDNRVPSARELVYNDKRANAKGRLPDDTWLIRPADAIGEMTTDDDMATASDDDRTFTLRPQDLPNAFTSEEDTWYFPRVAGTFKERAGFHGCQMPEQLLGRIIRTCSEPEDLVLDPFSGSATTLAVAKKLNRRHIGIDLSSDYVEYGRKRLASVRVGDRLDGSPEPTKSAPRTTPKSSKKKRSFSIDKIKLDRHLVKQQSELTKLGIIEAFKKTHDGFSADRVVADPELNQNFLGICERLGLAGDPYTWNRLLFALRKQGKLKSIPTTRHTSFTWNEFDQYMFASEIAWQRLVAAKDASSLDDILCDPVLASRFDESASRLAPGHSQLMYRWAALKLRKEATDARGRASSLSAPSRFKAMAPLEALDIGELPDGPGLYLLSESPTRKLYAGETKNLRNQLTLDQQQCKEWLNLSEKVFVQYLPMDHTGAGMLAWQCCLVKKHKPRLNYSKLRSA